MEISTPEPRLKSSGFFTFDRNNSFGKKVSSPYRDRKNCHLTQNYEFFQIKGRVCSTPPRPTFFNFHPAVEDQIEELTFTSTSKKQDENILQIQTTTQISSVINQLSKLNVCLESLVKKDARKISLKNRKSDQELTIPTVKIFDATRIQNINENMNPLQIDGKTDLLFIDVKKRSSSSNFDLFDTSIRKTPREAGIKQVNPITIKVDSCNKTIKSLFDQNFIAKKSTIISKNTPSKINHKLEKINRSEKIKNFKNKSQRKMSHIRSKLSVLLQDPFYLQVLSQMKLSLSKKNEQLQTRVNKSFVSQKSELLLKNRLKIPIEELLLQKGKINQFKIDQLEKKSIPTFQPNLINKSKSLEKNTLTASVFDRLYNHCRKEQIIDAKSQIFLKKNRLQQEKSDTFQPEPLKMTIFKDNSSEKKNHFEEPLMTHFIRLQHNAKNGESFFGLEPFCSQNNGLQNWSSNISQKQSDVIVAGNKGNSDGFKNKANQFDQNIHQSNKYDIFTKSQHWLIKKEGKLSQMRSFQSDNELNECTFKPNIFKKSPVNIIQNNNNVFTQTPFNKISWKTTHGFFSSLQKSPTFSSMFKN